MSEGSQVVLLGTGTPVLDPDRAGPAVAVVVDGSPYLVDVGRGVVRMMAAAQRARLGGWIGPLQHVLHAFITHLHSDHTVGYPDFLLSPWAVGRRAPVTVIGPPGLDTMTTRLLSAYDEDIAVRSGNRGGPAVEVHETVGGPVYKDALVEVTAFAVRHPPWQHALGYRFDTPDRCVVISGDTSPCPSLIEYAQGCDVLVHEVYARSWIAQADRVGGGDYHRAAHTSSDELGALASQARPSILVLYHQLFGGTSPDDLLAEVAESFDGRIVSANDLDVF